MRTFLSFLLGVCALLAALVAVPSLWVSQNLADEDGYVSFAAPLATDPGLHEALGESLSEALLEEAVMREDLRPVAGDAITRVTTTISEQPGFQKAWDETQRRSHQISFGDPRDLPAELDDSSGFAVDLAPLGEFVVEKVNALLPFSITAPGQVMIQVNGTPQSDAIEAVNESTTYARNGLIAVVVAGALALLAARRRSIVVLWLGLGTIAVAGMLKLVAVTAVPEFVERNSAPSPFAKALQDAYVERAQDSFGGWLVALAIGGAVAAVAGVVLRGASSVRARGSAGATVNP